MYIIFYHIFQPANVAQWIKESSREKWSEALSPVNYSVSHWSGSLANVIFTVKYFIESVQYFKSKWAAILLLADQLILEYLLIASYYHGVKYIVKVNMS